MTFKLLILMAVVVFLFTSGCVNKQFGNNVKLTEEEKTALRQADMWVPDEKEE